MKRSRQTIIVSNGTKAFSTPQVECKKIGDNESYRDDPDRPREVPQIDMTEIWVSQGTAQAIRDRMLPSELVETGLRRILLCPPGPQPDRSRIEPCTLGGSLLHVSDDLNVELIMRSCPSCESKNTALRRLLIHQDIYFSKIFRVPTPEQKQWINQDKRAGNDSDPRPRGA